MELVAVGDKIVCEVKLQKEKQTDSGIVIPSSHDNESLSQALVVSVGEKVERVKAGDQVILSRIQGEVFWYGGQSYYALTEKDIFAILR